MNRQQSLLIDGKILNFSDDVKNRMNPGSYDAKNDYCKQSYESFSFQEKLSIAQNDLLNTVPSINGSTHFGNGINNMDQKNLMIVYPNLILPEESLLGQINYLKKEFASISNTENQNENHILIPIIPQSDLKHEIEDINNIKGNKNYNTSGCHPLSIHNNLSPLSIEIQKPTNNLGPIEEAKTNSHSRISSINDDNTFPNKISKSNGEFAPTLSSNMGQEDEIKVVYLKLKIDNYDDNKEKRDTELDENRYLKIEERDELFMKALQTQKYEDDSKYLFNNFIIFLLINVK